MNGELMSSTGTSTATHRRYYSLDAVDDLMDNPTFEDEFTSLAKGLPDLERLVSRIHAGSCKPKDFLKVLGVGIPVFSPNSLRRSIIHVLTFGFCSVLEL